MLAVNLTARTAIEFPKGYERVRLGEIRQQVELRPLPSSDVFPDIKFVLQTDSVGNQTVFVWGKRTQRFDTGVMEVFVDSSAGTYEAIALTGADLDADRVYAAMARRNNVQVSLQQTRNAVRKKWTEYQARLAKDLEKIRLRREKLGLRAAVAPLDEILMMSPLEAPGDSHHVTMRGCGGYGSVDVIWEDPVFIDVNQTHYDVSWDSGDYADFQTSYCEPKGPDGWPVGLNTTWYTIQCPELGDNHLEPAGFDLGVLGEYLNFDFGNQVAYTYTWARPGVQNYGGRTQYWSAPNGKSGEWNILLHAVISHTLMNFCEMGPEPLNDSRPLNRPLPQTN